MPIVHRVAKGTMPAFEPSRLSTLMAVRSTHPSNRSQGFASAASSISKHAQTFGFRYPGTRRRPHD
jgi:hypothetical protein